MRLPATLLALASLLALPVLLAAQQAAAPVAPAKSEGAGKDIDKSAKPDASKEKADKEKADKEKADKEKAGKGKKAAKKPPSTPARELFGAAKTPAPLA